MRFPLTLAPRDTKPFDVVGFGENSLDLIAVVPGPPTSDAKMRLDTYSELPGGVVSTAMVACARQGWRARYVGSVGSDRHGARVEEGLRLEGVDLSSIRRVQAANRLAIVIVERQTGKRLVLEQRAAELEWPADEIVSSVVTSGRVLLVDSRDLQASTAAAQAARAASVPTVVDVEQPEPGVESLLSNIDVLIAAESFPAAYTGRSAAGDALRQLAAEFRPALAVTTLGADGALALCGGREIRVPAFRVPVVDTIGAGDAFRGGFISAWLKMGDVDVETLLQHASATAALNCQAFGAQRGLPGWNEVDSLVTGARGARSN